MGNTERIHELAEELAKLFKEEFPKASDFEVNIDGDYIYVNAMKWGRSGPKNDYTNIPRRKYLEDRKYGKEKWITGNIELDNKYYETCGILMKEAN